MIYEIINPHDAYTMEASDHKVAAVAICLIGANYAIEAEDGSFKTPIFFDRESVDEFFKETFGKDWQSTRDEIFDTQREDLFAALDSVMISSFENRVDRIAEVMKNADPIAARLQIHDKNRSSLSDLGSHAWNLAKRVKTTK